MNDINYANEIILSKNGVLMYKIIEITSFDGYTLKGKLTTPSGEKSISKLVLFVNGSGVNTYDNHRRISKCEHMPEGKEFNYYDFYANYFSEKGTAFFSYNTRGVDISDNSPMFADINDEEYKSYLPLNSVKDIYHMIKTIKSNERLKNCKVYLLGWSEGAIIAPIVADKYPEMVDGLFLAGYPNDNMKDILTWQNSGGPSMVFYRYHFDKDGDGKVSKSEYEADPDNVVASILQNTPFDLIDNNRDGYIDENDFISIWKNIVGYNLDEIFSAIERKDDEWLKSNYGVVEGVSVIPLTSAWFSEHFGLRSNYELLPTLNLPIYIFQGALDQNCGTDGVHKIKDKFIQLHKTNLSVNIFDNHNHDLNYMDIVLQDKIPVGIQAILDAIENE